MATAVGVVLFVFFLFCGSALRFRAAGLVGGPLTGMRRGSYGSITFGSSGQFLRPDNGLMGSWGEEESPSTVTYHRFFYGEEDYRVLPSR